MYLNEGSGEPAMATSTGAIPPAIAVNPVEQHCLSLTKLQVSLLFRGEGVDGSVLCRGEGQRSVRRFGGG